MKKVFFVFGVLILLLNPVTLRADDSDQSEKAAKKTGALMDDAERYLEEYGSVSMSVPILSKLDSKEFSFDLNRGATNYYADAKNQTQAAGATFKQVIQSLSVNVQAQWDPTVTAAYTAQLGSYFSNLQRYQTKQNLLDLAAQQNYQAQLASATNADQRAQAMAVLAQQYGAGTNPPVYPTADTSNTNLPPVASSVAGRPNVTNVLSGQSFLPFQGLLTNAPVPTISDRSAILQSAGDYATESIFRYFLGNTNLSKESPQDNLYFGLSTVSVNPGWRTTKGWAGEVLMTAEVFYTTARLEVVRRVYDRVTGVNFDSNIATKLYRQYGGNALTTDVQKSQMAAALAAENYSSQISARKEKLNKLNVKNLNEVQSFNLLNNEIQNLEQLRDIELSKIPTNYIAPPFWVLGNGDFSPDTTIPIPVTIISPMIDAEVQDLEASTRSQTEFALALSFALRYAGMNGQAQAFEQFVKNKQFDLHTRSQSVAVNAFSGADGKFGFQIGARLKAIGNPASASSGPDQILDRQSFPALLIMPLGAMDMMPKLWQYDKADTNKLLVLEPQIRFTQMRRWTPMKHFFSRDGWGFRVFQPKEWGNPPLTEKDRLEFIYNLKAARDKLSKAGLPPQVYRPLFKRIENLESELAGGEGSLFLAADDVLPKKLSAPPTPANTNKPPAPLISRIIPDKITLTAETNSLALTQQIILMGTGLDQIDTNSISFLPQYAPAFLSISNNKLERVGQALTFNLTVLSSNLATLPGDKITIFKLMTTNSDSVVSAPLTISVSAAGQKTSDGKQGNPVQSISFTSTGTNGVNVFNYNITGPTNIEAEKILTLANSLIKSDLEKNKSDQNSSNTVLSVTVKPGTLDTNSNLRVKLF